MCFIGLKLYIMFCGYRVACDMWQPSWDYNPLLQTGIGRQLATAGNPLATPVRVATHRLENAGL